MTDVIVELPTRPSNAPAMPAAPSTTHERAVQPTISVRHLWKVFGRAEHRVIGTPLADSRATTCGHERVPRSA